MCLETIAEKNWLTGPCSKNLSEGNPLLDKNEPVQKNDSEKTNSNEEKRHEIVVYEGLTSPLDLFVCVRNLFFLLWPFQYFYTGSVS
jgi:hypothetical protein